MSRTLEAYLNHLGSHIITDWPLQERLPPDEKLVLVAGRLGLSVDLGCAPYQSFCEALSIRNDLAHGKTVTLSDSWNLPEGSLPDGLRPTPHWERNCTPQNAARFLADIREIAGQLDSLSGGTGLPFDVMGTSQGEVQPIAHQGAEGERRG